jgi:RNA-binding protein
MPLTGKQIRHLRGLGHHLDPVVLIGKNGVTEAVVAQLGEALLRHELLKIKLLPECPIDRHEAGGEIAKATSSELVQTLGKTLLFWKRNPQATKVELPKASGKKSKKPAIVEVPSRPVNVAADVDDDAYADLEDDDAPKVKRPHPRVIEERPPAKRAAPAKRPAPVRRGAHRGEAPAERAAPVRRGANRGEAPAERAAPGRRGANRGEVPAERAAPGRRGTYRDEAPAAPSDKRAAPSDKRAAPSDRRAAPNRGDLTYNREKGARPAEKRPYSRDRSVPEERERRPFSRDHAAPAPRPAPRQGQSGPRRGPPGASKRGPKP